MQNISDIKKAIFIPLVYQLLYIEDYIFNIHIYKYIGLRPLI